MLTSEESKTRISEIVSDEYLKVSEKLNSLARKNWTLDPGHSIRDLGTQGRGNPDPGTQDPGSGDPEPFSSILKS